MLESNLDVAVVSKLLNHDSTVTTEKFYLKESIAELLERVDIPMYRERKVDTHKKSTMPSFLVSAHGSKKERRMKRTARIASRMDLLKTLSIH
jgi:hypothetical protein